MVWSSEGEKWRMRWEMGAWVLISCQGIGVAGLRGWWETVVRSGGLWAGHGWFLMWR